MCFRLFPHKDPERNKYDSRRQFMTYNLYIKHDDEMKQAYLGGFLPCPPPGLRRMLGPAG